MCHHASWNLCHSLVLLVRVRHAVIFHPLSPHLRCVCAFCHVLLGGIFCVNLPKLGKKALGVVGEFLRWIPCIVVICDSDQDEDMEPRDLFEVTVAAELATLSKLLDRRDRIPILFFDILLGRVLSERTVAEFTERFPSLVVLFEIFQ